MKQIMIALVALVLVFGVAFAQRPDNPGAGGRCVAQGIAVLKSLGAISGVAKGEVDLAPFGSQEGGLGLIYLEFDEPFTPQLSAVIKLHISNPELFSWCNPSAE
jgi:hypothetical protein